MAQTLLSTHTISSEVSSVDITSNFDNTYDVYEFHFVDIETGTAWDGKWGFQVNVDGGSGFNEYITSTYWRLQANESGSHNSMSYQNSWDLTSSTNPNIVDQHNEQYYQAMNRGGYSDSSGNDGYTPDGSDYLTQDGCHCGILTIYNPANTTYNHKFQSISSGMAGVKNEADIYAMFVNVSGYIDVNAAIDEISFKYHNGTVDSGVIYMFGIS